MWRWSRETRLARLSVCAFRMQHRCQSWMKRWIVFRELCRQTSSRDAPLRYLRRDLGTTLPSRGSGFLAALCRF